VGAELALFYYSLVVLLAVVLAAATCFASALVSRSRAWMLLALGFLFYFFDVALVFQDDFLYREGGMATPFFIGSPIASIATGGGAITSFWLAVCEHLDERSRVARWLPGAVYAVGSLAVLVLMEPGNVEEFFFYGMRMAVVMGCLLRLAATYAGMRDEVERMRMDRHARLYAAMWVLSGLVVAENVAILLVMGPEAARRGPLPFFPERNFAENALVLCCAGAACVGSWKGLALRRGNPPSSEDGPQAGFIDQNLPAYSARKGLSQRESEVLRMALMGKDNQNIASSMNLAPGTVKVHMHHILQKAQCANRKELMRDFWESR